jgi:molecular chaperone DnaK (HSP70)
MVEDVSVGVVFNRCLMKHLFMFTILSACFSYNQGKRSIEMLYAGIDIGMCFSSIAIINQNGEPEAVKVSDSAFGDVTAMPTAVYSDKDRMLYLGNAAVQKRNRDCSRYRGHYKKLFGDSTPLHIGDDNYTVDELYTEIFMSFRKKLEEFYGEKHWEICVTHPASYLEPKRTLLTKSANNAGFMKVKLLDEPTAAAIMYAKKSKVKTGEIL